MNMIRRAKSLTPHPRCPVNKWALLMSIKSSSCLLPAFMGGLLGVFQGVLRAHSIRLRGVGDLSRIQCAHVYAQDAIISSYHGNPQPHVVGAKDVQRRKSKIMNISRVQIKSLMNSEGINFLQGLMLICFHYCFVMKDSQTGILNSLYSFYFTHMTEIFSFLSSFSYAHLRFRKCNIVCQN